MDMIDAFAQDAAQDGVKLLVLLEDPWSRGVRQ